VSVQHRGDSLKDKVALITGGGRGIGKAIAIGFAEEGAKLFLGSRTELELIQTVNELRRLGADASALPVDVSKPDEVRQLVEKATNEFGKVDILINNAAILGPIGLLEENDETKWLNALRVNLFGAFLCCKFVIPLMKRQKWGRIINISGAGAPLPYPRFTAYSSSKTALLGFTQSLAEEARRFGITVNAIAPGRANTRMQDEILAAGSRAAEASEKARMVKEKGGVDLSKTVELAIFLASESSNAITGRLFSAHWDNWQVLRDKEELARFEKSELYVIRRIDGILFRKVMNDGK
jgi:NAD(P)-dependent dehydrogenase (short-subunit alcohol dehydrogenase family)